MQKDFKWRSLSVISKLKSGGIDNTKALIPVRSNVSISEDNIILFYLMYLHWCDHNSGGKVKGSDASGNLFTDIVRYMVIGLKSNAPYVSQSVPKANMSGLWLKNELETTKCVVLQAGFSLNMAFDCSNW